MNTEDQNEKFWTTGALKQHFKEWCIWYHYTFCVWVIFQDHKKWTILEHQKTNIGMTSLDITTQEKY